MQYLNNSFDRKDVKKTFLGVSQLNSSPTGWFLLLEEYKWKKNIPKIFRHFKQLS